MKPHQIISLMTFDGADNTLALPDHYDHIHVGFHPLYGDNKKLGKQLDSVLKPGQWIKLIDRIGDIENPTVRAKPSKYSITDSTIRQILQLQGAMEPHQIISLMTPKDFGGATNVLPMQDHDDHIHVGFRPQVGQGEVLGKQVAQLLEPGQWIKLIDRIGEIANPEVPTGVSKDAIKTGKDD
jgi:hypothetical protein